MQVNQSRKATHFTNSSQVLRAMWAQDRKQEDQKMLHILSQSFFKVQLKYRIFYKMLPVATDELILTLFY